MFDLGWTELMVIGIVALIVVGPKDLPKMFRTLGQFTAKARSMAREFQRAMDDAADSTGVKDVARDLRRATDPQGMGLDEVNKLRNWDPLKDPDKKGKPPKSVGDVPKPSGSASDDDETMDRITAEMENLRKERAPKSAAPKASATPEAGGESASSVAPKLTAKAKSAAKPKNAAKPKAAAKNKTADAHNQTAADGDTPDKSKA